uniref:Fgf8/17/18 n=1 Tax=Novocrania anomala TaxID=317945 RepID=A0A0U2TZD5_9BILA|nr:fgf8/17/18 [Novocrania anomala]
MGYRCMRCGDKVLFAVVVISQLLLTTTHAFPRGSFREYAETGTSSSEGPKFKRYYKLYSRCSRSYVSQWRNSLSAMARKASEFDKFIFVTNSFNSQLRIKVAKTNKYVCFNRLGRVTLKVNAHKDNQCLFEEKLTDDNHTRLQSVGNREWFLGFNRKGKVLRGYKQSKKCMDLMKIALFNSEEYQPFRPGSFNFLRTRRDASGENT